MTASTKPEDAPESDPASDRTAAAAPAPDRWPMRAAMTMGGVALIVGAVAVAAHVEPRLLGGLGARVHDPQPHIEALAALSIRMDAVESRLAETARSLDGMTLERESLATMADRMDAMANHLDDARRRIETVAQEARAADASERVEALANRIAALETALADTDAAVRTAEARRAASLAELESRIDELAGRTRLLEVVQPRHVAGTAALALAIGQLRDAALDGRPFSEPLSTVEALLAAEGGISPGLARALRGLEDHAADGVATPNALRRKLNAEASAILRAGAPGADSWVDETLRRLAAVVTVRRTGDVPGADVDARLARAEAGLLSGDLAAAAAELAALTNEAADAAAGWLTLARARLTVESGLASLHAEAAARVATIEDAAGEGGSPR